MIIEIQKKTPYIAALVLSAALFAPAGAQPARTEPADAPAQIERSRTQPVIRTYEKFPDPDGDDQDNDLADYENTPTRDLVRYRENTKVIKGNEANTDYIRYSERNEANDGSRYTGGQPSEWFTPSTPRNDD
ncbi:MAG TPA: hypothetical protein EYO33_16470 [Phycisphaerales bacterium]|nr:hypothetical protein [Phycisphaerales bacterium]